MALKLKLPDIYNKSKEENLNSFIKNAESSEYSGAINTLKDPDNRSKQPWEETHIRTDIKKIFNLRLNEEDFIKLNYISQITGISKHKICVDILIPEINKKLQKIND